MPNTTTKFALALFLALAMPATSFARGGGDSIAAGSSVIPGTGGRPNAAVLGTLGNMSADPSGIGNASRIPPLPQPKITVPVIPQFK